MNCCERAFPRAAWRSVSGDWERAGMRDVESRERFTSDEVEAILRRALTRRRDHGDISRSELVETARELGIAADEIERAIDEHRRFGALEEAREQYKARKRSGFYHHLRSYLIVNAALMALDLLVSGGTWFYFPLIGWGIGLAFHASNAFNPGRKEIDRGARRILRKRHDEALRYGEDRN